MKQTLSLSNLFSYCSYLSRLLLALKVSQLNCIYLNPLLPSYLKSQLHSNQTSYLQIKLPTNLNWKLAYFFTTPTSIQPTYLQTTLYPSHCMPNPNCMPDYLFTTPTLSKPSYFMASTARQPSNSGQPSYLLSKLRSAY